MRKSRPKRRFRGTDTAAPVPAPSEGLGWKLWLLIGAGATIATGILLSFTQRGSMIIGKVVSVGQEAAFKAAIPSQARPLASIYLQVAREKGLDPFTLVALAMRESQSGVALAPDGTGDGGHGRGIMQIDDRAFTSWVNSNDWRDPLTNIRKGADVLKSKIAFFQSKGAIAGLTDGKLVTLNQTQASARGVVAGSYPDPRPLVGDSLARAAIAAYNTGEGNVLRSVAVGKPPDVTTAGANYSQDVLAKLITYSNAFKVA